MGMKDDRAEELLKDLRKLIDMLKALMVITGYSTGLIHIMVTEFLTEMENKYLN